MTTETWIVIIFAGLAGLAGAFWSARRIDRQQARASDILSKGTEQQLKADEQLLKADEQHLKAAEIQLREVELLARWEAVVTRLEAVATCWEKQAVT